MQTISWDKVFAGETPGKGATDAEVGSLVAALGQPLSETEVETVNDLEANPAAAESRRRSRRKPTDPHKWQLPTRPLPSSYVAFLKWSNGGSFVQGARGFNFLPTNQVREFTLSYHFPELMPGALPFAFDGDDNYYAFDMRAEPVDGEYPILFVHGDHLGYSHAIKVADSFLEAAKGTTNPAKELKD